MNVVLDPFGDSLTPTQRIMRELDRDRRLAIMYVTPDLVVKLAVGRPFRIVSNPVPWDAEVINTAYLPDKHYFGVILRHESFEKVPVGELLPVLDGVVYGAVETAKGDE